MPFLAACPIGSRPLGGGYDTFGSRLTAAAQHPVRNAATSGDIFAWRVQLRNNTDVGVTTAIRVHAVCARVLVAPGS
jgi:hypothetical protein